MIINLRRAGQSHRLLSRVFTALLGLAAFPKTQAQASAFTDVPATYWAKDYIETLEAMEIISGFPDSTFLPDAPVTRAQFATIVNQAFLSGSSAVASPETSQAFADVPADHWALEAINAARISAFLSGYPGNLFRPEQNIPRVQTLVSLVNGLNYAGGSVDVLPYYKDASDISDYAREGMATASASGIVVNYPTLNQLSSNREATRAEVAASVYWAMVRNEQISMPVRAPYRVPPSSSMWKEASVATLPVVTKRLGLSGNGERLIVLVEKGDRTDTEKVFAIQVWNVKTGELVTEKVADEAGWFSAISISEDGQKIATIFTGLPDYEVELLVWNLAEEISDAPSMRQSLGTVRSEPTHPPEQLVDAFTTTQVAFRPGDNAILTQVNLGENNMDGNSVELSLQLYDSATGEVLHTLSPSAGAMLTQFAFSPDGSLLTGKGTTSAEMTDAGSSLIDVWQLGNGERFATMRAQAGADSALAGMGFTETGAFRSLEQSYTEASLNTWNLQTDEQIEQLVPLSTIDRQDGFYTFSSDGVSLLVSGTVAGTRILNTQTQTTTSLLIGPTGFINSVFSQDGRYLAVATLDNVQVFSNAE
ncbi:MAG: S-layer homology domain-containing protein [Cyanobacteria bacterium J06650_10]